MKLRIGTAIAFGIGYSLGTRSARERTVGVIRAARRSAPVAGSFELVTGKAKAAATLGVERVRDTIGVRLGWRDGEEAADAIAIDLAADLATALDERRRSLGLPAGTPGIRPLRGSHGGAGPTRAGAAWPVSSPRSA